MLPEGSKVNYTFTKHKGDQIQYSFDDFTKQTVHITELLTHHRFEEQRTWFMMD